MVKKKLNMFKIIFIINFLLFTKIVLAESNLDQWIESEKTYQDLINEGFEVKSYDTLTINTERNLFIMMFVTVLQKEKEVFECQEYQTMDDNLQTLDMSLICKKLTQPYLRGVGT